MKLRCKDGDVAIVIDDAPGCVRNVGRMVRVSGPVNVHSIFGPCWLIQPLSMDPWAVQCALGVLYDPPPLDRVEHPDHWLLPLGDGQDDAMRTVDSRSEVRT